MNTISYKDLKDYYLNNDTAKENAKKYFGDVQPNIHQIGFYSAPSWNWAYQLGIVGINGNGENGIQSGTVKYFEVVTQFGVVKAARAIYLPIEASND
jgi:hypothetical protein